MSLKAESQEGIAVEVTVTIWKHTSKKKGKYSKFKNVVEE